MSTMLLSNIERTNHTPFTLSSSSRRNLFSKNPVRTNIFFISVNRNNSSYLGHTIVIKTENAEADIMIHNNQCLQKIQYANTLYELRETIILKPIYEDNCVLISYDDLGIYVCEETLNEAVTSFCEEFDFIYRNYAKCPNSELTSRAIELKDKIKSYVREVGCY